MSQIKSLPYFYEDEHILSEHEYQASHNTHGDVYVWERAGVVRVHVRVTMENHDHAYGWDWPRADQMRREVDKVLKPLHLKRDGSVVYHEGHNVTYWSFNYSTKEA